MLSTVPTRRELLAWMLVLALLVTQVITLRSREADAGVPSPSTQVVYIATGANFPDALAAAASAALGLGPVLLVQQDAIPQPTLDELNRLEPRDIVVVGGLAVIAQTVEDQLNGLPWSKTVTRISGANRYATAAALSLAIHPTSGMYPRVAYDRSDDLSDGTGGAAQNLIGATIVAPANGILVISAGADFFYDSSTAVVSCWITLDGDSNKIDGSLRFAEVSSGNPQEDCSTEVAVAVAPGNHSVVFRVNQDANVDIGEGALNVEWIPFGGHGEIPPTGP